MMIRDTGKMEDIHEAHFYHEDPLPIQVTTPLIYEKDHLHLKLQPDHLHANPRLEQLRRNNIPTELINSPDFGFLKLASPDLEKMLLAFQSGGSDSPTGMTHTTVEPPSNTTLVKHVDHSKGLAEALQDLHDRQDIRDTPNIIPQLTQGTYVEENAAATDQLYLTTDASGSITVASTRDKYQDPSLLGNSFSGGVTTVPGNDKQLNASYVLPQFHAPNTFLPSTTSAQPFTTPLRHHTDENDAAAQLRALAAYNNVLAPNAAFPSQVFKLDSGPMFGDSSGLQPIDLEMQEMVKRERKKQRNRVASSKCRKRKLEKEAVLETTVKDLRARNVELSTLANALKQQICNLKQKVMDHVTEGCPITLQHVEDPSELYDEEEWDPISERT